MRKTVEGVTIDGPRELDAALRGFRAVLGPCGFNIAPAPNGFRWELSAQTASAVPLERRRALAIPFGDGPTHRVAAECFSRTGPRAEQIFSGLSIDVLRLELQSGPVEPLLRVEWQAQEAPEDCAHAQPHWHVYGSVLQDEPLTESYADTSLERMHFAVAARWHEAVAAPIYVTLDDTNLDRWIKGCLSYVWAQLQYLRRRRST